MLALTEEWRDKKPPTTTCDEVLKRWRTACVLGSTADDIATYDTDVCLRASGSAPVQARHGEILLARIVPDAMPRTAMDAFETYIEHSPGVGECATRHRDSRRNFRDNSALLGITNSPVNDAIRDAYSGNPNVQYVHGCRAWDVIRQEGYGGVRRPIRQALQSLMRALWKGAKEACESIRAGCEDLIERMPSLAGVQRCGLPNGVLCGQVVRHDGDAPMRLVWHNDSKDATLSVLSVAALDDAGRGSDPLRLLAFQVGERMLFVELYDRDAVIFQSTLYHLPLPVARRRFLSVVMYNSVGLLSTKGGVIVSPELADRVVYRAGKVAKPVARRGKRARKSGKEFESKVTADERERRCVISRETHAIFERSEMPVDVKQYVERGSVAVASPVVIDWPDGMSYAGKAVRVIYDSANYTVYNTVGGKDGSTPARQVRTKGGRAMARILYDDKDTEEMCVRCVAGGRRACAACTKDARRAKKNQGGGSSSSSS